MDLSQIWSAQRVSAELLQQIGAWSNEVDERLRSTSSGRMISEWAKRGECCEEILGMKLSAPNKDIPEISANS